MSGGKEQRQTTSSVAEPWGPAQPYLENALGEADTLFKEGVGFNPNTTSMVTPFAQQTEQGMQGIMNAADHYKNSGGAATPRNVAENIVNQGGTNQYMDQALGNWQNTAAGNEMQGNPYFEQVLDKGIQDAQNSVNLTAMGLGRYGSGAHQGNMAREIGDLSTRMRYQDFSNQQGRKDQATQNLITGGQQALANRMNAAAAMPTAYANELAPYQDMMGVGGMYEDLQTRQLNDQARVFEETEQKPWERLMMANAIFSGAGSLGGTRTGVATQPGRSPFSSALGGAATGYGVGGPVGALVGGGLGLFS